MIFGCDQPYETISLKELEKTVLTDSVRLAYEANPGEQDIELDIQNKEYMDVYLDGRDDPPDYRVYFKDESEHDRVINSGYYPYAYSFAYGSGDTIASYMFLITVLLLLTHLFFLYDVLKNDYQSQIDKLIWFLMMFVPIVGPLFYVMLGRRKLIKASRSTLKRFLAIACNPTIYPSNASVWPTPWQTNC